jgi:hypothetical protein
MEECLCAEGVLDDTSRLGAGDTDDRRARIGSVPCELILSPDLSRTLSRMLSRLLSAGLASS